MENEVVILDLFAGIGGFSKGFQDAGFTIKQHFFSEVDRHAIANYKHNFKNSIYVGPVQTIRGASLPKVDIITFGSPCQDFSLAGKREGLGGERSSLISEAVRIISEKRPSFFIWENVKGAFSSNNSEDFWAIIQTFANIGCYNIEWQLLNTLWILPQNRERIYLVGHLATAGRDFRPIFPFTKNDRLFNEGQNRKPQATNSRTIRKNADMNRDDTYIKAAKTLLGGGKGNTGGLHRDMTTIKATKFSNHQQDRVYDPSGAMCNLPKNRTNDKVKIFAQRDRNGVQEVEFRKDDCTNTLTSVHKDNLVVYNTQPRTGDPKVGGTGFLKKENEAYCLDASNSMAIETNETGIRRLTEIECERLQGFPDNWTDNGIYLVSKKVNRYLDRQFLTPTAFGLLMLHAHNNFKTETKEIASTNRYEMLGNAVTAKLVTKIALKLKDNYNH